VAIPLNHATNASPEFDGSVNIVAGIRILERAVSLGAEGYIPPVGIRVVFLGAQIGPGDQYPLGSRRFLEDYLPSLAPSVWYLDMPFAQRRTLLGAGATGILSPYWLIQGVSRELEEAGVFHLLLGNENQVHRLGLSDGDSVLDEFLGQDYPSVSFRRNPDSLPAEDEGLWVAQFVDAVYSFVELHPDGFPIEWDKHYLFFQVRRFFVAIPELWYLALFVSVLGAALAYPLVVKPRFFRYVRTIARNVMDIPLLYLISFGFLLAATGLVHGIAFVRKFPDLWTQIPGVLFLVKLSTAFLLFVSMFRFLKRLPFSRNSSFYSGTAIFLFLIAVIVTAVANISVAYYFLWAFAFSFFFSLSRTKYGKTAAFLASTLLLAKGTWDIFSLPALDAVRTVLLDPFGGNLLLALVLLPYLLMLIRLDFLFHIPTDQRRRSFLITGSILALGMSTVGFGAFAFSYNAYTDERLMLVDVTARGPSGNGTYAVLAQGPAPFGEIVLTDSEGRRFLEDVNGRIRFSLSGEAVEINEQVVTLAFLDRERYRVELDGLPPWSVDLSIRTSEALEVYDANFPYVTSIDETSVDFFLGINPPMPLLLDVTLPAGIDPVLVVDFAYRDRIPGASVQAAHLNLDVQTVVRKEIPLTASD
jgi:hypothetical protein